MNHKQLRHTQISLFAGLAGWLLLVPSALGEFDRAIAVDVTTKEAAGEGLRVTDVYATGNVTAGDKLLSIGDVAIAATHDWYQHPSGDSNGGAPNNVLVDLAGFETLKYDSYITFNRRTDVDNTTQRDPDFDLSAFGGNQVIGGWFWVPGNGQGLAVDVEDTPGNAGQAGVLIARLTINVGFGDDPCGYSGTIRMFTSASDGGDPNGVVADILFDCDACPAANGTVTLSDFDDFVRCVTGPGAKSPGVGCDAFDFDCDDDVDLVDWGGFQIAFASSE